MWEKEPHPSFIISDPTKDRMRVLVVNATTCRNTTFDKSCVLAPGDHPTISHSSYIIYQLAETWPDQELEARYGRGRIDLLDPLVESVLGRILMGAAKSPVLVPRYKDLLRSQGLIS